MGVPSEEMTSVLSVSVVTAIGISEGIVIVPVGELVWRELLVSSEFIMTSVESVSTAFVSSENPGMGVFVSPLLIGFTHGDMGIDVSESCPELEVLTGITAELFGW